MTAIVELRRVAEDFWVAPQLETADFALARELGVKTVLNNRPDGEAPDQQVAEPETAAPTVVPTKTAAVTGAGQ